MAVYRAPQNPIITPAHVKPYLHGHEVVGAFNAAATRHDSQVLLLVRVAERPESPHPDMQMTTIYDSEKQNIHIKEFDRADHRIDFSDSRMTITPWGKFLTSLSHFRVARSDDGINFQIEDQPFLFPENEYEAFGLEDPRITKIGDTYYITYVAVSNMGVVTCLASTKDFKSVTRHGIIFEPDNKDVFIFPEMINGKYYAINRPVTPLFEKYNIWISESPDLVAWGNHRHLLTMSKNHFDSSRVGGSAVPFRIDQGWLLVYHGVDPENRYTQGAVLLDPEKPWQVLARSQRPFLEPEESYEIEGFFGNVVFVCGCLFENQKLKFYYGVADTSLAYCEVPLSDVLQTFK